MDCIRKQEIRTILTEKGSPNGDKLRNSGNTMKNKRLKPKDDPRSDASLELSSNQNEPRNAFLDTDPLDASSRNAVFLKAAQAFSLLQHRDGDKPAASVETKLTKRTAAQLDLSSNSDLEVRFLFESAYSTLKYQELLSDLLSHCGLYTQFPELKIHNSLVMIILNDFINNSFEEEKRTGSDVTDPLIIKVKRALRLHQTRISACLARHRIRANALTVDSLLPEKVRTKERISSKMNAYVWVNQSKTSIDEVVSHFYATGFNKVDAGQVKAGKVFAIDHHCYDVMVFPPGHTSYLLQSPLYKEGKIILQDKSSCIAPHSVRLLVKDEDDIMHVNVGSGLMTAHISSLLLQSKGRIWGLINDTTVQDLRSLQKKMEELNAKNVKILPEPFLKLSPDDWRFRAVKVILLTANCSKSALNNPVDFVVNEGEDMSVLKRLSRGGVTNEQLEAFYKEEVSHLKQALLFPNLQAVIYLTRSVYELENETVVSKVVEYVNTIQQPNKPPYKIVPPVLQFNADEIENNVGLFGKFIKFNPSDGMNGCFLAIIARETENKSNSLDSTSHQRLSSKTTHRKSDPAIRSNRRSVSKSSMDVNNDSCWSWTPASARLFYNVNTENNNKPKHRNSTDHKTMTLPVMPHRLPSLKGHIKSQGINSRMERLLSSRNSMKQPTTHRPIFLSEHKKIINHPKPFR